MNTRHKIRAHEVRWLMRSVVLIVLLCAVVNVPYALTKMRSQSRARVMNHVVYGEKEAAARGWVTKLPHKVAWPEPNSWMMEKQFGFREYHIRAPGANEDVNGFQLQLQQLGWPMPVIEVKQMWWDWDDPTLMGPESDPSPGIIPLGFVMNPLLVGVPVWMVLCVFPIVFELIRRSMRERGGRCVWCGYELEGLDVCPECGTERSIMGSVSAREK